jgi:Uma2 family endonuclease
LPISVGQYHRMIEAGIVPEDSTVELLYGMLTLKDRSVIGEDPMGHSDLHRIAVGLLAQVAVRINNALRHLQIQLPIDVPPDQEPEPDGAVIRGNPRDYGDGAPGPGDVYAVIEVAHSSLKRDREEKSPVYASAAIPQYVIVNLIDRTVEIYTEPNPALARYGPPTVLSAGQTFQLHLGNGEWLEVRVDELLP